MENDEARFRKIDDRLDRNDRLVGGLYEEMTALVGQVSTLVDAQIRTQGQMERLENAFATFAKFAKSMDERMDSSARRMDDIEGQMSTLTVKMSALVDAQIRTEAHIARLENAFVTFAEFAKSMDERMDSSARRVDGIEGEMSTLTVKMSALVDAQIRTEAHVARLENAIVTFAELAQSMDERMDNSDRRVEGFDGEMATLSGKIAALVDAQIRTEAQLSELTQSQARTAESIKELTQSQARTDESIKELTRSQALTNESIKELTRSQAQPDDRLNALTHIVDRHVSGNGHEHSS